MVKEVTGSMDADARVESRVTALERNDGTQDKQISELFQRVNGLERNVSAQGATQEAMQADIKTNGDKFDKLIMWMLGLTASTTVTVLLLLLQFVAKKA